MTRTLCIEIGCEEIPARFCLNLFEQIETKAKAELDRLKLSYIQLRATGSYRRLILLVDGLTEAQPTVPVSQKGPAVRIGKDGDTFKPAAIGFAKKFGLTPDQLIEKDVDGEAYLFAEVTQGGGQTLELIPQFIADVFGKLNLPVAMRWGAGELSFIRPVHWVCVLFGETPVDVTFMGISSNTTSRGHRLLADAKPVTISAADQLLSTLEETCVQADHTVRRQLIVDQLHDCQVHDYSESLLVETTFLTEWPVLVSGRFHDSYLELPDAVVTSFMIKHQKYFPVHGSSKLRAQFVCVADNVTSSNREQIIAGNESVLRARLEDASFFYQQDQKRPLLDRNKELDQVVFQKNLGSIAGKVVRIEALSTFLASGLDVDVALISDIAKRCKSDLPTLMVGEMPALQGVMGQEYARLEGLDSAICDGIFEHYLPRSASDALPTRLEYALVGLSDRFDTLVCCFCNGLMPTGSQDPWALRRLMNAVCKLIDKFDLRLDMMTVVAKAWEILNKEPVNETELKTFVQVRQKQYLSEFLADNIAYDIIDALSDQLGGDLMAIIAKAKEIQSFREAKPAVFKQVVETANRCANLSVKGDGGRVDIALLTDLEKPAYDAMMATCRVDLDALGVLSEEMTTYFENVMVMDEDAKLRANRLAFLQAVTDLFSQICQFDRIVIS